VLHRKSRRNNEMGEARMRLIEEEVYQRLISLADGMTRLEAAKFSAYVPDDAKWVKEYCVWKLGRER